MIEYPLYGEIIQYDGIRLPGIGRPVKFCFPEGTCYTNCLIRSINNVPSPISLKQQIIYNIICKDGVNIDRIRKAIQSTASDNTLWGYIAACAEEVDELEDIFWKNASTKAMRLGVTEIYTSDNRLKDIYSYLQEQHDSACVGKSLAEIYTEIRIILIALKQFEKYGMSYPEDWF